VRSQYPTLAADIARNLLAAVDRFNRARVQSQSASEREFTEEQVANAAADLRAAEDRLQTFQDENRAYDRAPRLTLDHDRLVREVSMRQQLYASLAQAYAQARIDAVRDNPSVVVLESPDVPPDPEPRGLAKTGLIALMAGFFLGVLLAFVREHIVRTRELHPEEEAEYATLRAATARDLRNPFRLLAVRRGR
jgi:tyrosine-protein kinase Etk/Wzc